MRRLPPTARASAVTAARGATLRAARRAPAAHSGAGPLVVLTLEGIDHLPQVLLREQALRLHLPEDLPPPLPALLLRRDLVERQRRRRTGRLRLEQRTGDFLLSRGELGEHARTGRLRPRADRRQGQGNDGADDHCFHTGPPLSSLKSGLYLAYSHLCP